MSKAAAKSAQNFSNQDQANANGLEGTLTPIYSAMANGRPTAATTAENTSLGQTVGGGQSSALGALNLQAARTRNAAGFAPAADLAARDAEHTLTTERGNLAQKNQQIGLAGLQGLYGTNADNALKALGIYSDASNQTFGNQFGNAFGGALGKTLGTFGFAKGGASLGG